MKLTRILTCVINFIIWRFFSFFSVLPFKFLKTGLKELGPNLERSQSTFLDCDLFYLKRRKRLFLFWFVSSFEQISYMLLPSGERDNPKEAKKSKTNNMLDFYWPRKLVG